MKITRLRLLGFKSFVEATDLVIEPGLTGVVGPNGCGKSNLLEALRWVMGETSHKSMRAAAMDDVIFSGTNTRPARNTAEVTIVIDNTARLAPAEFNTSDTIEITRRIEREAGSAYRVNNREIRARDVKVLFEDAATGARSPALVRQGQIGEIVNAKPEHRRRILEDAAGIAGLHTRRHEAELRMRAAETNLARIADVAGQLTSQAESLKRQARQARRYKDISSEIRSLEALTLHLAWTGAQAAVAAEEESLTSVMTRLGAATDAEAGAQAAEAGAASQLPPLREAEAAKSAALARLSIEQENFEREADRLVARGKELEARLAQLTADRGREAAQAEEAHDSIARLAERIAGLEAAEANAEGTEEAARAALQSAEDQRAAGETALAAATQTAAEFRARVRSLDASLNDRNTAIARLTGQISNLDTRIREVRGRAPDAKDLAATAERGQTLGREISDIEAGAVAAEEASKIAQIEARARRDDAARVRLAANAFSTERETIAKLLAMAGREEFPPIVDSVRVSPGYETALGAALGDDLEAPAAEEASVRWRRLDVSVEDQALPADAEPLALHCVAPPELHRRLQQIGVVDSAHGAKLQPHLKPGQRLVSREGDLWRWDGFVAASHGVTPAAQRLAQKNRLIELDRMAGEVLAQAKDTIDAERDAADALTVAEAEERRLRQLWREKQSELARVRERLTGIERQARDTDTRLAALNAEWARAADDLKVAETARNEFAAHREQLGTEPDPEPALLAAQGDAETARRAVSEERIQLGSIERERAARAAELKAQSGDVERWQARRTNAAAHLETLNARIGATAAELASNSDLPDKIVTQRSELLARVAGAEETRSEAANILAKSEAAARTAAQALRSAQAAVSDTREAKAGVEARLEAARGRRQDEARRIRETFEVAPETCLSLAGLKPDAPLPAHPDAERQLTKLKADRERLGGVNLQADDDLVKVSSELDALTAEQADVEQAIAKLRGAIGQLNKEGKSRLDDAFQTVNGHFTRLFTHLFGGGEARLEMVESVEDPLHGGLEIIAKPPGKKPATLSLLSGGEQTLTALSLIFAVFLTNPSPICVLDEVDAPLDDANVDRFCRLMEQMAKETDTRFLVITHHPMTMARMNRLFGVTMAERGVSQLVSVNLETAQQFQEAV